MENSKMYFYLIAIVLLLTINTFAQDGTLDSNFGVEGVVETNIEMGNLIQQKLLKNQKIMLLRDKHSGDTSKVSLIKFNEDGSKDQSFADNGFLTIMEKTDSTIYYSKDFAIQSDGKIYLLITEAIYPTDTKRLLLYRFNADGTGDNSFGVNGLVLVDYNDSILSSIQENYVCITKDNKILLTLVNEGASEIRQYNTNGDIDIDFGNNGVARNNKVELCYGLEIDNSGNIYALYDLDSSFTLRKYLSNGSHDLSFGNNGIYVPPLVENYNQYNMDVLTLQRDDKILVGVNSYYYGNRLLVYRINQNGTLDSTFSDDGIVELEISDNNNADLEKIIAMPDGDILVGVTDDAEKQEIAIHKFDEDGHYNNNFGNNGIVIKESEDGIEETFENFIMRSDDFKIVVAGKQIYNDEKSLILVRYLNSRTYSFAHVSGNVSGIWDVDTVYVDGDIIIPLNEELTIRPNTYVYFSGEYKFDVYGTLTAKGTEADSIFFCSDSLGEISSWPYYAGYWYGITFHSTDENGQTPSSLDYCNIKYAYPTWLDEMSNRYGGGLIFYKSQIDVKHTTLTDCLDENLDKGVFTSIRSNGNISDVSVLKTTSYRAGTMSLLSSNISVNNLYMYDAYGLYVDSSNVIITKSYFDNCTPYIQWGIINTENSEVEITDCEITNNNGIGINSKFSELKVEHTLIKGNNNEGGLFIESPSTFTNCEIIGNGSNGLRFQTAQNWGTTFTSDIQNCVIANNGATGIKFLSRNNANITNCTIADNNNSSGWGGVINGEVDTHLKNCIVYNNGSDLDFQAGGLYTYSIIQGNYVGSDTATTNLQNVEPLFRDAANGDYHLQSTACGYDADSPGIDAGDPSIGDFVLDCSSAGLGTELSDIGAYGGAGNWWEHSVNPSCYYSGEVSGIWDCDTIHIIGDILVPAGETLTITENVKRVYILGAFQIKVEGALIARGPENERTDLNGNRILFTGSKWHGIFFNSTNGTGQETSVIENCRFDYADKMDIQYQGGGAINIYNSDSVIVKHSVFYNNTAKFGGAMYIEYSNSHIEDCYFELNGKEHVQNGAASTTAGGALYIKTSNPYLHKLQFINNYSVSGGGAMVVDNSSTTISNILLVKNETAGLGGAIEVNANVTGSLLKVVNMTSADNIAMNNGGGTFHTHGENTELEVINSIMYGNTKVELFVEGKTPVITYSIIDSAFTEPYFGIGCVDTDPRFEMTIGNYYYLSSTACGYSYNSDAIDAGHPDSLDAVLDCEQGLGTSRADMGYYGGRYSDFITDVKDNITNIIPTKYSLLQNYPNPFNPSTTIQFAIPEAGKVSLKIYNILGEQVAVLINREMNAGYKSINFDASKLSSGVYLYRLKAGKFNKTMKLLLLK